MTRRDDTDPTAVVTVLSVPLADVVALGALRMGAAAAGPAPDPEPDPDPPR